MSGCAVLITSRRMAALVLGTAFGLLAAATPAAATPGVQVVADATLPRIPLADFQNGIADDRGVALGGIGSDLFPVRGSGGDVPGEFWMVTDRGPNGQIKVDGANRRTFPVPDFDPAILRVKVDGKALSIARTIPITTASGDPVTGLPDQEGRDEKPFDFRAEKPLPINPSGLDVEGLVQAPDGSFWLSEEYSPSLLHVSADGEVLARYVPEGLGLKGAGYPVREALPGVLLARKVNRGFESLAISPDGKRLAVALQSPLSLPTAAVGDTSRNVRLFFFDVDAEKMCAEFVYPFDDVTAFDPGAKGDRTAMKISGLAWAGHDRLLVDERTDAVAKLYTADLRSATDVLGRFDDAKATPALEQADLAAVGVTPIAKKLALDVTGSVPGTPGKIEGIALLDEHTVALANDNDFGMTDGTAAFGADGRLKDSGIASRLLIVRF